MASTTFSYTGGSQSFVVPTGVTSLTVECWGAQGGAGISTAGLGGYLKSTQTVTPGETLDIEVGRSGNTGGTDTASYNGGGRSYGGGYAGNLMGGGASDVRRGGSALANRIAVAGGGGGAGGIGGGGSAGGGTTGGGDGISAGGGGTQSAGGGAQGDGSSGSLGNGGAGGASSRGGSGGGGGYYGGGGGNSGSGYGGGPGGGGSSYASGTITTNTQGGHSGNGQVTITYPDLPGAPTIGTATAGDTSATVTWSTPGSDGGSAITGYWIYPSSGPNINVGVVTSYTVTGLTNGTAYAFKVAAINAVGTGSQSGSSNSVSPFHTYTGNTGSLVGTFGGAAAGTPYGGRGTGSLVGTFGGSATGLITLHPSGSIVGTFGGSGTGVLTFYGTGSLVGAFGGLAAPLPGSLVAPIVSA